LDVACCAISHAATARQSWVAGMVEGLGEMVCGPAPVLLLVGRSMQGLLTGTTDAVGAMEFAIAEASRSVGDEAEEG
jgi:uroporphyrin-III C-methyltransferase